MALLYQIKQSIVHTIKSRYWRGHHVHSPFVYHLIRHVITTRTIDNNLKSKAKKYRKELLANKTEINIVDLGTRPNRTKKISQIAKNAAITEKYGLMLARIIAEYKPQQIIELGTSLGISTLYIAQNSQNIVETIEGCPNCASIAQRQLDKYGINNVKIHIGNFDDILPQIIDNQKTLFAYIDGNHTENDTKHYFELLVQNNDTYKILIFDDIHLNEGMLKAWKYISADSRIMTSIETAQMGIAIVRKGCQKEYFRLNW